MKIRNKHGVAAEVKRVERLPNGLYRIDYVSGLVECMDDDPRVAMPARPRPYVGPHPSSRAATAGLRARRARRFS